jgi:hypothetical protein
MEAKKLRLHTEEIKAIGQRAANPSRRTHPVRFRI